MLLDPGRVLLFPEKNDELIPLIGEIQRRKEESEENLQERDLQALMDLKGVLERQPERVIDRIGLEYYRIIRSLCYVVSPTPVRVLSQFIDSKKAWRLNRTNLIKELKVMGLEQLGSTYKEYYLTGWEAFEKGFNDNEVMRLLIKLAYEVLWLSYMQVKE
jgi:hypothetical protein